jgi:AcrR family transcriptional regulator
LLNDVRVTRLIEQNSFTARASFRDTPGARRVLDAAIAAFAALGYDSAGLRSIAKEAGVDAALIVHLFGSKAQLWRACVDAVAERLIRALREGHPHPGGDLADSVDRLVEIVCDEPVFAQFILSEIVRQDERFDYVFERLVSPIHALMRGSEAAGDASDEIRFLALSGAIATTVVSRRFMIRNGLLSPDLEMFRAELRKAVGSLLPRPPRN